MTLTKTTFEKKCDLPSNSTQSDQAAQGQNALSSIGWMFFFIGDTIHPGIESIFCVISIDLNTPKGFQDIITEQK